MKRTLFVLGLSLLLSPAAVKADVIGVAGQATLVSPPASVDLIHFGTTAIVFDEE